MAKPKIPSAVKIDLEERGLTIWQCNFAMKHEPGERAKEDRTKVHVQLAGPGLEQFSPWGYGATVEEAVNDALSNPHLRMKQSGLIGAVARLESEIYKLTISLHMQHDGDEDDIPF